MPPLGKQTENMGKVYNIATARQELYVKMLSTECYSIGLIRRTACERVQFSGYSSKTNTHSETGQMAVCCQNLPLGALCNRSAPSVLVGELF